MFICTIANYSYAFSFKLSLDGTIELEATLTGILSIGALPPGGASRPWGQTLEAQTGLYGPDHQHLFIARCDMAVDGVKNRVVEVEVEPAGTSTSDEEDAYVARHGRHNAFRRRRRLLASEKVAAREGDARRGRHWIVESCTATNGAGEPTGWKLEPGAGSSVAPACDPAAPYLDRASFLHKNLWVTRYRPEERFPGGDFPNQRPPSMPDGLAHWVARDDGLDGADVVLWHVFGVTHTVRTEDAPVMPCEHVGFHLKPCGFFDSSPCIDVPCEACNGPRARL